MQRSIDKAENELRARAAGTAFGGDVDDDEEEVDVSERALRFAARLLLEDCMRQCEARALRRRTFRYPFTSPLCLRSAPTHTVGKRNHHSRRRRTGSACASSGACR